MAEDHSSPKEVRDDSTAAWLIPALALVVCSLVGLYFAAPFLYGVFFGGSRVSEKSPVLKAINNARQVIICLRLYSGDHEGKYPARLDDLLPDYIDKPSWDVISQFNAAPDGKPRPWLVSLDLTDSDPAYLPVVIAPVPIKGDKYIVGFNDGSITFQKKSDYVEVLENLRKFREERDAKAKAMAGAEQVPSQAKIPEKTQ